MKIKVRKEKYAERVRTLKIVHVIDYFQPEVGYQETFLAKEQIKLGYEVHIITSDRYSPLAVHVNNTLDNRILKSGVFLEEGITIHRLETLFEKNHRVWMINLKSKLIELNPDIVYVHGIVTFSSIRIALLKKKSSKEFKLVYDDHMLPILSRNKLKDLFYPIFRLLFKKLIISQADALVAVTSGTKHFMIDRYGIPAKSIKIIPLGADKNLFKSDINMRRKIRNELNIQPTDVVYIYIGKIIPEKGIHLLVDAGLKLIKKYDNAKVMLIGEGSKNYIEQLKQNIESTGKTNNFLWINPVPNKELVKYYSSADIGVWPLHVSIGMYELQACSLPIIISNRSPFVERICCNNGLTYEAGDVQDLVRKMENLLRDEKLRLEMGKNGRKLIEEKFNWRVIAKQFIDLVNGREKERQKT